MRAVVCETYGDWNDLKLRDDWPAPDLPPGGVRVRIEACSVGFATMMMVAGTHQNRSEPPFVPATEIAGEVVEVADGVASHAVGDLVAGSIRNGALAAQAVAPAAAMHRLPDGVSCAEAVHIPTIYGTAYGGLAWRAGLKPKEWVLVPGAAGATGLAGVQVGKALGARVIATASTEDKRKVAADAGADVVLPPDPETLAAALKDVTGGRGVDVVYDPVGGAVFDAALRGTAQAARLIIVGFASGDVPRIPANLLLVKNMRAIGLYWGHYLGFGREPPTPQELGETAAAMQTLFGWLKDGTIRPLTYATYDLADFREAFAAIAERRIVGKAVLVP
ncbi:MAG: NADPH:quinone oxidoreductase family protein [Alphaproteobacteria bacterium]